MKVRKLSKMRISAEIFAEMFKAGARPFRVVKHVVPDDAKVFDLLLDDDYPRTVVIVLESEEFVPQELGTAIPEFAPLLETIMPQESA